MSTDSVKVKKGSLTVVGSGLSVGQMTLEARAQIETSDKVVYLVSDPITEHFLRELNHTAESLQTFYRDEKNRMISYKEMIQCIITLVHEGLDVCAVFYGHPGVFTYPSHESIRQLRAEGYSARMLPGISAEDCLYADLGIDPGTHGSQSFEATDFIARDRIFDAHSYLIIWQIGVIGDFTYSSTGVYKSRGMDIIIGKLTHTFSSEHEVILYKASVIPLCEPDIRRLPLHELANITIDGATTLVVPPLMQKRFIPDIERILEIPDILHINQQSLDN